MYHIAYETVVCRNPHNSSNLDYRITGQLGHKHTFCQNVVSTEKFSLYVHKNLTCLSVGLLRMCHLFLSPVKVCVRGVGQIAVS